MYNADRSVFERLHETTVEVGRLAQDGVLLGHEALPLELPLFTASLLCCCDF